VSFAGGRKRLRKRRIRR
jgi:hypothetical protein